MGAGAGTFAAALDGQHGVRGGTAARTDDTGTLDGAVERAAGLCWRSTWGGGVIRRATAAALATGARATGGDTGAACSAVAATATRAAARGGASG